MIDIGVNFTNSRFSRNLHTTIARANMAGISKFLITGTDISSSEEAIKLSDQFDGLFCTAGIHPHYANTLTSDDDISKLKQLLTHPKVKAAGETGLDFNRNFSSESEQIFAFEQQLELAQQCKKPLFLHERDAFSTQYSILKNQQSNLLKGVLHCFTGNREALKAYLDLGLYIGITGWICDERRGLELQQIVSYIPDDQLLLETDAPYLTPRTLPKKIRNKPNEPLNLSHIADTVAQLRGQTKENIYEICSNNANQLFEI